MLSERIKELRTQKGITQVQFAKEFKIASGTIAMWETGKRQPDYNMLIKISDFFGVTVDYLLGHDIPNNERVLLNLDIKAKKLLDNYQKLNEEGKNALVNFSSDMVAGGRYKKGSTIKMQVAALGEGPVIKEIEDTPENRALLEKLKNLGDI